MSESSPVAGTFRLDGMLQGSLPPNRPVAGDMNAWAASAKASGLHFHLSIDGSNFSIVADPAVQKVSRLAKPDLETLLVDALDALLSSFFIDYRKLFTEARDRVVPLAKEEVTVDHSALGKFIEVELAGVDNKRNALIFKLKRGPEWDRAFSSSPAESTTDWPAFMTQLAIHQRRLRIELFDKDGKTLSSGEMNLEALHQKETAEIAVYAKLRERLAKVVIRP